MEVIHAAKYIALSLIMFCRMTYLCILIVSTLEHICFQKTETNNKQTMRNVERKNVYFLPFFVIIPFMLHDPFLLSRIPNLSCCTHICIFYVCPFMTHQNTHCCDLTKNNVHSKTFKFVFSLIHIFDRFFTHTCNRKRIEHTHFFSSFEELETTLILNNITVVNRFHSRRCFE